MRDQLEQALRRLSMQLEQDLRRLLMKFEADVGHAVLRALHAKLHAAPSLDTAVTPSTADRAAGVDSADAAPRAAGIAPRPRRVLPEPRLTAQEASAVRERITAAVRQQPGLSTRELASILGISSAQLRPQLHQLENEEVISIEKHHLGGVIRYIYRIVERPPGHDADLLRLAAGVAA